MIYIRRRPAAGFDWDEFNAGHIARHGLQPADVEHALASGAVTIREVVARDGEPRWVSVGPSGAGGLLAVVWTVRRGRVRVVTAYPASKRLKVAYAKANRDKGGSQADGEAEGSDPPVRD